ncbi:MAG: 30S ribosomal protein S8 [Planctomycetota bacterium]|jgi:small subunit ribosomal protein S8
MSQQDLTADMLTRIRNAVRNRVESVDCLNNKLNQGVAQVLVDEGYVTSFDVIDDGGQGILRVRLKYGPRGEHGIITIDRASRTGQRIYRRVQDLPRPSNGLGIAIVSTSKGVMSDRRCRRENVAGEVVAIVT